jgi:thioredoxin-related protein
MRLITTLTTIFLFMCNSIAADTTITFRQINYSEVFELAKKEKKSVFLYFHFDGCGACVQMERTAFVDKDVADFYNENFICIEVNTRNGQGIETNKIYNVELHPTFLYLDETGNILHKIVGVFSPNEFVLQAQYALIPKKSLAAFKEEYEQGRREADFLFEYCYKLRDAYELDSLLVNEYLNTQSFEDLGQERNIKFIYEFAVHNFNITIPFESIAFQFLLANKDMFTNYFEPDQVETRIVWILNYSVDQGIENQDEALFNKAIEFLSDFDTGQMFVFKEMDGRTTGVITSKNLVLLSRIAYFEKSGDTRKYQEAQRLYIDKIWDDSNALNTTAWNHFENYDDKNHLESAKSWVIRSIELNSNYENNDTYAALLYKLGDYDDALQQAETAISIAEEDGKNYQETTRLIRKIKDKMKN